MRLLRTRALWVDDDEDADEGEDNEEEATDELDAGEPPAKRPIIEEDPEDSSSKDSLWKRFLSWIVSEIPFLQSRKGRAGIILNFLRGLELTATSG